MIKLNMERTGMEISIDCNHRDDHTTINTRDFLITLEKFLNQIDSYSDIDIRIKKSNGYMMDGSYD